MNEATASRIQDIPVAIQEKREDRIVPGIPLISFQISDRVGIFSGISTDPEPKDSSVPDPGSPSRIKASPGSDPISVNAIRAKKIKRIRGVREISIPPFNL